MDLKRINKKIIIITAIIILAGLIISFIIFINRKSTPKQNNSNTITKEGTLVKNNPGFEKDVWYFRYQQPGLSAINYKLTFNDKSVCKIKNKVSKCKPDKIQNNQKVKFTWIKDTKTIIVNKLEFVQ
ncbi:MAG: hypothetical protein WCG91_03690 [Candidatus Shapirobacteria bacterium]